MTMVERVARALHREVAGVDVDNPAWETFVPDARAAIAAMREPLSEQEEHCIEHMRYLVDHASDERPEVCFDYTLVATVLALIDRRQAMIDAALEEK